MPSLRASSPEAEAALRALLARRSESNVNALRVADEMIAGVRERGDAFVREQIQRFDGLRVDEINLVPRSVTIDREMARATHGPEKIRLVDRANAARPRTRT